MLRSLINMKDAFLFLSLTFSWFSTYDIEFPWPWNKFPWLRASLEFPWHFSDWGQPWLKDFLYVKGSLENAGNINIVHSFSQQLTVESVSRLWNLTASHVHYQNVSAIVECYNGYFDWIHQTWQWHYLNSLKAVFSSLHHIQYCSIDIIRVRSSSRRLGWSSKMVANISKFLTSHLNFL